MLWRLPTNLWACKSSGVAACNLQISIQHVRFSGVFASDISIHPTCVDLILHVTRSVYFSGLVLLQAT